MAEEARTDLKGTDLSGTDLKRGRAAARQYAWTEALEMLSLADRSTPLAADDLHLMATAAYLAGRLQECVAALRRAFAGHVEADQPRQAARTAFWIAYTLGNQGEAGQAGGWLARAEQLVEPRADCAEYGLLLTAAAFRHLSSGNYSQGRDLATRAAEIGRRTGDADLLGLALTQGGAALARLGRADEAMARLDEAMVAVVSAEISPIAAGTVYCTVISICGEMAELRRAREWTEALDAWCGKQDMVVFTGQCLVHRAELLQLRGHWPEAVEEAERACERLAGSPDAFATGAARYRQAEIHRLSGDFTAAHRAYQQASDWGYDPCPGLALLRWAENDLTSAQAALRRALTETTDPLRRARLLPAEVELALAADDLPAARSAAGELTDTAGLYATPALRALAGYAQGAVSLAELEPTGALSALRTAEALWRDLQVPYEVARARVLIGLACRQLGDRDTATLELAAAARVFAQLAAEPDLARVSALTTGSASSSPSLTGRELQILRLVASGRTNQAVATELVLSEKTVERHLTNLFAKLGVPSRAAATAYAYRQGWL